MRDEYYLQLLADYVLLSEMVAGHDSKLFLQKIGMKQGLRLEEQYRFAKGRQPFSENEFAAFCTTFFHSLGGHCSVRKVDKGKLVLECVRCPIRHLSLRVPSLCTIPVSTLGDVGARNFPYCKIRREAYGSLQNQTCTLTVYTAETDEAKKADGIRFENHPAGYLLTPKEVRSMQRQQSWKGGSHGEDEQFPIKLLLENEVFSDVRLGVLTVDKEGNLLFRNEIAAQLLQNNEPECRELCSILREMLMETLRTQVKVEQHEIHIGLLGEARFFSVNTAPLFCGSGKVSGAACVFQDISEKKALENELLQMEKYSLLAELAAGTAHEIRNPMTTMRGFLQILAKEFRADTKGSEYCELLIEEIDRANAMITEFLLLTKQAAPRMREANLHTILDEIFLLIESKSLLEDVVLRKQYADNLPPIMADSAQLKQVFLNLATNAIQAMPKGGKLTISTSTRRGAAVVRFADSGSGMSEEQLKKIFDPFYTTKEQGTGLGLPISKRIIESHKGSISVKSTIKKGTVFTVELPALTNG